MSSSFCFCFWFHARPCQQRPAEAGSQVQMLQLEPLLRILPAGHWLHRYMRRTVTAWCACGGGTHDSKPTPAPLNVMSGGLKCRSDLDPHTYPTCCAAALHPSTPASTRCTVPYPCTAATRRRCTAVPLHCLCRRLAAAHAPAARYVAQFPSHSLAAAARFVAFVAGSLTALLLLVRACQLYTVFLTSVKSVGTQYGIALVLRKFMLAGCPTTYK